MIITIANQKGGVGKSATAQALAAGLAAKKYRVLAIDMDAQGTTSRALRAKTDGPTILDVMNGNATANDAIQPVETRHALSIIPAAERLALADRMFVELGSDRLLKTALSPIAKRFDAVVIDTPPALGILTANALTAANGVIIPACAEASSLQGISQLRGTIVTVKKFSNPKLQVMGILLTRFRQMRVMKDFEELAGRLATELKTGVYKTRIRELAAVKEAEAARQTIFDLAPNSNAAQDYANFVDEVLKQLKKEGSSVRKK